MMNVSIVILTFNEERNIENCLSSLSNFDDIHVVDSGSTDRTLELARLYDVKIIINEFVSFGKQRNFAHENCTLKYDWVLHLDADEEITDELKDEIKNVTQDATKFDCFNISSKLIFFDKFVKFASAYPTYQVRLLRRHMSFKDSGHGQKEICEVSKIGYLENSYLHYNFSHGITHWLNRHLNYAKKEADLIWDDRTNFRENIKKFKQFDRKSMKFIYSFVPVLIRPFLKFFYLAFWRRGILDGKIGLYFSILHFAYEVMIAVFYMEKRISKK
jgi:glycosyltransferase involved in cell wall biosynthesis